jgi:hypothetical protein
MTRDLEQIFDVQRIFRILAAHKDYLQAESDGRIEPYHFNCDLTEEESWAQEAHFQHTRLWPWIRRSVPDVLLEEIREIYHDDELD